MLALMAVVAVGLVAKNAVAVAANFGAGWHAFLGGCGRAAWDHDWFVLGRARRERAWWVR